MVTCTPDKGPLNLSNFTRQLIALMLSLLLPIAGMASALAPAQHCLDKDMPHAMTPGDMPDMDMDSACCDMEKSAKLGFNVCKPGQENCQSSAMLVVPVQKTAIIPTSATAPTDYTPDILPSSAETFWRPPRH